MTKAAKAFGKRLQNFMDDKEAKEYKAVLTHSISGELTEAKGGRYHGGTWAHPKLAVVFARWLDVKFAVWCDAVIDDILRGHQKLQMVNKAESAVEALPADVKAAGAAWHGRLRCTTQCITGII